MKTAFALIFLIIVGLICAAWFLVEYGKNQIRICNEYDGLYKKIQSYIYTCQISSESYEFINDEINKLKSLKWKDRERTSVLCIAFNRKYTKEWLSKSKKTI